MDRKRVLLLALFALGLAALISFLSAFLAVRLQGGRTGRTPLTTATIIQRVQALSEMVTIKYVLEKVVVLEDPKYLGGLIPLGENRIILLAQGQVKAGVDFSKLAPGDVSISGHTIVLTLPRARVTDAYLVEQRTQVLDYHTGLLVPFDKALEQTARRNALTEITRAARQNGIEEEATRQACQQMTHFLQALGFTEVEVRTSPR
jgi:hypothetical protein